MDLLPNKVPQTAYAPKGEEVGLVTDDGFPVLLNHKHHRLVMVSPAKYQIISGSFTGKTITFADFNHCRQNLEAKVVWMPIDLVEFSDFRGVKGAYGCSDRLVELPEEGVFVFSAGPHIGRRITIESATSNMMLAPES